MTIRLALTATLLLIVGACAQIGGALGGQAEDEPQQAQEFLPDGGPPVVNGFYEAQQWQLLGLIIPVCFRIYALFQFF